MATECGLAEGGATVVRDSVYVRSLLEKGANGFMRSMRMPPAEQTYSIRRL